MFQTLKNYFGYDSFRPLQQDIIQRQDFIEVTIHKNDGKTIVYKLNEAFNK